MENNNNLITKLKNEINSLKSILYSKKISNFFQFKSINNQTNNINCLLLLNDKKHFASASCDKTIKIYYFFDNKFKEKLTINEHKHFVLYLTQMKNKNILSSSHDKCIKIIKLNNEFNSYEVLFNIFGHKISVCKAFEMEFYNKKNINNNLISCSLDKTIKIWNFIDNNYKEEFELLSENYIRDVIEINENEIVSSFNNGIIFWDLNNKNKLCVIDNILCTPWNQILKLILNKKFLVVGGKNLYLIQIEKHILIKSYFIENSVFSIKIFNDMFLFTGDEKGNLLQWIIKNDENDNINLILFDKKQYAHTDGIRDLIFVNNNNFNNFNNENNNFNNENNNFNNENNNFNNENNNFNNENNFNNNFDDFDIFSCGDDKLIKIWK